MLWEYLGAGSSTTKWLYHFNWNADDSSWNWNNLTPTNITWVWWIVWSGSASFNWSNSHLYWLCNFWITNTYTINWKWKTSILPTSWNLYNFFIKWETSSSLNWFDCALYNNAWTYQLYMTHADWVWWTSYSWNIPTPTINTNYNYTLIFTWTNIFLYINWSLLSSQPAARIIVSATNNFYVWYNGIANIRRFNWIIDELIIEPTVWSAEKVKKYYTYSQWKFIL